MIKIYYPCNPDLHIECDKKNCYTIGGPCKYTTNLAYALQPVGDILMVMPSDDIDLGEEGDDGQN